MEASASITLGSTEKDHVNTQARAHFTLALLPWPIFKYFRVTRSSVDQTVVNAFITNQCINNRFDVNAAGVVGR
jgi:hypothetical protein